MRKIICTVGVFAVLLFAWNSCRHAQKQENIMPSKEQLLSDTGRILPVYSDERFTNFFPLRFNFTGALTSRFGNKATPKPRQPLPVDTVDIAKAFPENQAGLQNGLYVTWLGHSTVMLQIDGIRVLLDPVFSNSVSPVPWLMDVRRFQPNPPTSIEKLPFIDAVFISHDHYDHLDKKTILELNSKVGFFITPLKVGEYLRKWGIDSAKIREYGWWQEAAIQGVSGKNLHFACTPARHSSSRLMFIGQGKNLWSSWVFWGDTHRVFFSGDTGYDVHFRQIGTHYGPFDLTIIESGQYGVNWPDIHLMPEDAVKAHIELRGKKMLPVHWGSFNLSPHNWWEPIERASSEALRQGVNLLTPRIGQTLQIDANVTTLNWWQEFLSESKTQLSSTP